MYDVSRDNKINPNLKTHPNSKQSKLKMIKSLFDSLKIIFEKIFFVFFEVFSYKIVDQLKILFYQPKI